MKRKKLTLASGIIMVIEATYAIIFSIVNSLIIMQEILNLFVREEIDSVIYYGYIFKLAVEFFVYAMIAVGFMIVGVKLIIKSKVQYTYEQTKPLLIIALVFACVGLFADVKYISSGILIAIIVLTACAIAKGDKPNIELTQNTKDNNFDNVKVAENLAKENTDNIEEKKTETDLMVNRLLSLQELKKNGIITEEEYSQMVRKTVENKSAIDKEDKKTKTKKVDEEKN